MKRLLHNLACFVDRNNIHGRYKDAKNDLKKGLLQALPISPDKKEEIEVFWNPYKKSWLAKKCWDIRWFDIYNRTNIFDYDLRKYIPDSYYYCIVDPYFNKPQCATVLDDKNFYDLLFYDIYQPKTIFHKQDNILLNSDYQITSEHEVIKRCEYLGKVIIKPSVNSCAGSGIKVWDASVHDVETLQSFIRNNQSAVCQEYVQQSDFMAQFNPSCVSTLRVITLLFQGEVYVVTAVLIMGGEGAITNHLHRGGIVCGVNETGQLFSTGFDGKLNCYKQHPSGPIFADCVVPNYYKVINLVKSIAPRLCHVAKFISWDITLDKNNEPLLIETNLTWGGSVQIAAGPIFGDMTEDVLKTINEQGR